MRIVLLIWIVLTAGVAGAQTHPPDSLKIPSSALSLRGLGADTLLPVPAIEAPEDPQLGELVKYCLSWPCSNPDSAALAAKYVLDQAWKAGWVHDIALALACEASLIKMYTNDFVQLEKLSRASLYWFGRTVNKKNIMLPYSELGFALFAQSRFDEAIHFLDKARMYAHLAGDSVAEVNMLSLNGEAYRERGDYDKAFDIARQCLQMATEMHNKSLTEMSYVTLAELFKKIDDYASSEKYFQAALSTVPLEKLDVWKLMEIASLYGSQHKYDSALYYYGQFDSIHATPATLRTYLVGKGEYYLSRESYQESISYVTKSLSYQRQLNDRNQIVRCLLDLAKAYEGLGQNTEAFRYVREAMAMAGQANARQNILDASQILYTMYDKTGRTDSAYFYYRQYISLKDSVLSDQLKGKFASYGFEQQIKYLNQEKQLQDVCLREEMLTKNMLILGILMLFLVSFIYVWWIRSKRKNEAHRRQRAENELEIQRLEGERAKAALRQRAKELEVQALRSQMNPHFIFNCLNAINRFILSHETEAAADYLTKFSRLMRMIMNHSRHSVITLSEELEVLRLYLDMERLRFKDAFDYHIELEDDLDPDDVHIPPLLLQPFVENAVWHGLMHKEERGYLLIRLRMDLDILTCIIRDNGIGRKRAALLKSKSAEKHKSMGLQITAERMALLAGVGESGHFFKIEDLYDAEGTAAGTQVLLTIRTSLVVEPAPVIT